jgi:uncharacterized tellurite resistance protein B-like protein
MTDRFYTELGKYLYAIAMADGAVQDKEKAALRKTIDAELGHVRHIEHDVTRQVISLAKLSFNRCLEERADPSGAGREFLQFIQEHRNRLEFQDREEAVLLMRRVAHAYKGIRKTEQRLLDEAEQFLLR